MQSVSQLLFGLWNWKESQQHGAVDANEWPLEAIQEGLVWGCGAASCGTLTRGASVPSANEDVAQFVKKTAALN